MESTKPNTIDPSSNIGIDELFEATRDATECAQDAGLDWEVRLTTAVEGAFATMDVDEAGREETVALLTALAVTRQHDADATQARLTTSVGELVAQIVPDDEDDPILVVIMTAAEAHDGIHANTTPLCPQCHQHGYTNGACEVCGFDVTETY